jgi:hypothetical protein
VRNGIGNSLAGAKAQGLRAEQDIAGTHPPNGATHSIVPRADPSPLRNAASPWPAHDNGPRQPT